MSKQSNLDDFLEDSIFSVSEFLDYINTLVSVRQLSVQGEVTGAKPHQTGFYFSLKDKDDGSIMDCYMNPFAYRGLGFGVEDGMEIKVTGTPGIYKARGRFNFRIESIELAGEGSLKKAYELLKKKLDEEGLFKRKRELPKFISSVGIITSKTGAVIDDFRKNLSQLGIRLHLYDSRVEGIKAVSTIIKGIKWFNTKMPDLDVIVIMRGGGSLEDLQAFNNELVARALFSSPTPTICAIGHDRDIPIASLVADVMTSTPSIAAITINNSWNQLTKHMPLLEVSIWNSYQSVIKSAYEKISSSGNIISSAFKQIFISLDRAENNIKRGLQLIERTIVETTKNIERHSRLFNEKMGNSIRNINEKILKTESFISAMSPERNLQLGYSIVKNSSGKIIRDVRNIKKGEMVKTKMASGEFTSEVSDVIIQKII